MRVDRKGAGELALGRRHRGKSPCELVHGAGGGKSNEMAILILVCAPHLIALLFLCKNQPGNLSEATAVTFREILQSGSNDLYNKSPCLTRTSKVLDFTALPLLLTQGDRLLITTLYKYCFLVVVFC